MSKRYSRKLLVDPRYQVVQMAVVVVANILVTLLVAGLLSWFYLMAWDGSVAVHHNRRIVLYISGAGIVVTVLSILFSLHRSRIVAGMMKKLHQVLENALQGDFPPQDVAFRKNDYYPQLAEPLNRCLDRMRCAQPQMRLREDLKCLLAEIDSGGVDLAAVRHSLAALIGDEKPVVAEQAGES
nr:hypothetical protein [uncultured Desulfobulbus sp.]